MRIVLCICQGSSPVSLCSCCWESSGKSSLQTVFFKGLFFKGRAGGMWQDILGGPPWPFILNNQLRERWRDENGKTDHMLPVASSKATTALTPYLTTPDSSQSMQLRNIIITTTTILYYYLTLTTIITTLEHHMFAEWVTHSCVQFWSRWQSCWLWTLLSGEHTHRNFR